MYLLEDNPEQSEILLLRVNKILEHLFAGLPQPDEQITYANISDLYSQNNSDSLYIIVEGTLSATFEQKTAIIYEAGDLVGLNQCYKLDGPKFHADEPIVLNRYDATTLLRFVNESKEKQSMWSSYLITLNAVFVDAYGRLLQDRSDPHTGFINFNEGDVIIKEGDEATDVYTIIQGRAEVYVKGSKVGEVLQDEIFGAMAVFTAAKRSASVIAAEQCSVLAVPKDEFVTLMNSHPETTLTLIENMARCITSLNNRLSDQGETEEIF